LLHKAVGATAATLLDLAVAFNLFTFNNHLSTRYPCFENYGI
jgi:hypothetical protein